MMHLFSSIIIVLLTVLRGGSAEEPETLAEIGETISNASVLLGNNAFFYCEVIGNQGIGESLTYSKIAPDAYVISVDSDVIDTEKHEIKNKYELKIKDAGIEDEGAYECSFGAHDYVAYLTVSDPPATADIYWNDHDSWTERDEPANLTCYASNSYPPASFRWYRGSTSLTRESIRVTDEDNYGYGKAWSYLEMEPTAEDEGDVITCYVDMPHKNAYYTQTIAVSFSGAGQALLSTAAFLIPLVSALRL